MLSLKHWACIHKWTSLICTLFMLLLCLTGLPLIFADEIDQALGRHINPPKGLETQARVSVDTIVSAAQRLRPKDAVQFLSTDADEKDVWFVRMGKAVAADEASAFYSFDARTGALLGEYPLDTGLMNIILRLHIDLFAGLWGTLFLGLMGVLLMVSLVSGVVLYAPFMRKLAFGTVRYQQSSRLLWLDWHNLIGIVTLIWFLVVGFTGVVNTLATPIFSQWQHSQLAQMLMPYQETTLSDVHVPVQTIVSAANTAIAHKTLSFLAFPGNPFAGKHHFVAYLQGTTPLTAKLLTPVIIDAHTGSVVASAELPVYVTALLIAKPLHFGDYGGLPLKIIWALLDALAIWLLVSGLVLWWKKRNTPFAGRMATQLGNSAHNSL